VQTAAASWALAASSFKPKRAASQTLIKLAIELFEEEAADDQ
jgi:hypothetical protein